MRLFGLIEDNPNVIDLTDDEEGKKMQAKVALFILYLQHELADYGVRHKFSVRGG